MTSVELIQPAKPDASDWRPNILIFGASGTGKTKTWLDIVKLTGARALVIDTHRGTTAWVRQYPDGWDVVHTADPDQIEAQINHYLERPDGYSMFVIDDISVAHTNLQGMADDEIRPIKQRKDRSVGRFTGVLDPGAQAIIKRHAHIAVNRLTQLDMARVVVARSKPHYESSNVGGKLVLDRKGKTWAGDNNLEYDFDFVVQLEKAGDYRYAVVEKGRGMEEGQVARIEEFTAQKFLDFIGCGTGGFVKPSIPNPLITDDQAKALRDRFDDADLEPGRQSAALNHFGAKSIDDLPRRHFETLMAMLARIIQTNANTPNPNNDRS